MQHGDVRRDRGVALGGQADPFLPSRTMPPTAQVGNSSQGRRRTALRGQTTPQGHPDYRWVAQEMFRLVAEVHPRLAEYARFVDMGPGDELERRRSERRLDQKLSALEGPTKSEAKP